MKKVVLLSLIAALCCGSCSSTIPDKQVLRDEKLDAVTASGENRLETGAPDPAVAQRSRVNQTLLSPTPLVDKNQPISPPATPFPLIPSVINQTNFINQVR